MVLCCGWRFDGCPGQRRIGSRGLAGRQHDGLVGRLGLGRLVGGGSGAVVVKAWGGEDESA